MTTSGVFYYLGVCAALTIAPGPDNTFVVAQGIARGRKAAIVTALGMCSGVSIHTVAAAIGVSALLYASATAFALLKYAGAAYLLWLAYQAWQAHSVSLPQALPAAQSDWVVFRRGFLMNVVNPKVGIFFLAFLPQFVVPDGTSPAGQMLLLGALFMVQAIAIFCVLGYLSGSVGELVRQRPGLARVFAWLTAGVLASLGIKLALAER